MGTVNSILSIEKTFQVPAHIPSHDIVQCHCTFHFYINPTILLDHFAMQELLTCAWCDIVHNKVEGLQHTLNLWGSHSSARQGMPNYPMQTKPHLRARIIILIGVVGITLLPRSPWILWSQGVQHYTPLILVPRPLISAPANYNPRP